MGALRTMKNLPIALGFSWPWIILCTFAAAIGGVLNFVCQVTSAITALAFARPWPISSVNGEKGMHMVGARLVISSGIDRHTASHP